MLRVALEAAETASYEANESDLTTKQIGMLNEQWVHSYVGHAISDHLLASYKIKEEDRRPFVTYETSAGWLNDICHDISPGPYANGLKPGNRFDLAVWSKGDRLAGLIEIKHQPIMQKYASVHDCEKLMAGLRKWGDMRWGMFLYSVRASKDCDGAELDAHLSKKADKVDDHIEDCIQDGLRVSFAPRWLKQRSAEKMLWCGAVIQREG